MFPTKSLSRFLVDAGAAQGLVAVAGVLLGGKIRGPGSQLCGRFHGPAQMLLGSVCWVMHGGAFTNIKDIGIFWMG